MKTTKLYSILALLFVAISATSCKDDPEWQPTWAIPVVKETSLTVGEFITQADVEQFNAKIKEYWDDYVNEQLSAIGGLDGQDNIDSAAYFVLTDSSLNYVVFPDDGSAPELTPSTDSMLRENGLTEQQIEEINDFLQDYWNQNPGLHQLPQIMGAGVQVKKARIKTAAGPASTGSKGAIDNLLLGITKKPESIFPTVASLMTMMPSKADEINNELDEVLKNANMDNLIDLSLRDITGVVYMQIDMDMENTLPFLINFSANFTGSNRDSVYNLFTRDSLFDQQAFDNQPPFYTPPTRESLNFYIDNSQNAGELQKIINETEGVLLKAVLIKKHNLTPEKIKNLTDKGIKFGMRVKVKTRMNELLSSF